MDNDNDPEREAFRRQIEEARAAIDAWEHAGIDFLATVPETAACSLCFLAGRDPQPTHYLLMLCPQPGAGIATYRAAEHLQHGKPGETAAPLYLDTKAIADNTAVVATVVGLLSSIMRPQYEYEEVLAEVHRIMEEGAT